MRRIKIIFHNTCAVVLAISLLTLGPMLTTAAQSTSSPSLVIAQLKMTSSNGQFITLYNAGATTIDMSKYQLEYFNNYDLSKATSSRVISLSGNVPPHGYYMINDSVLTLCYELSISSQSLGLSTTAGMLELMSFSQSDAGGSAAPELLDYVSWSKTATKGAQTLPTNTSAFLQRQPLDSTNNPSVSSSGSGSWLIVQPDPNDACKLVSPTGVAVASGLSGLLPPSEPPATIITTAPDNGVSGVAPSIPASDVGLMSPSVTELLPNPDGTGNDSSDEYIELYNPNSKAFDLSGFSLQVGTTSLHTYVFPNGTNLPANSFVAFYSERTGLSLSNSGGQAKLLDPFGNSLSAAAVYGTAKDGQAWALAKGKWYWTTKLTPSSANVIVQPVTAKKSSKSSSPKSKTTKRSTKKTSSAPANYTQDEVPTTPIHKTALALVVLGAIIYGAYEYRADLANRIFQLRRYFASWRANRTEP